MLTSNFGAGMTVVFGLLALGLHLRSRKDLGWSRRRLLALLFCGLSALALVITQFLPEEDLQLVIRKERSAMLAQSWGLGREVAAQLGDRQGEVIVIVTADDAVNNPDGRPAAFISGYGSLKNLRFHLLPQLKTALPAEELLQLLQQPRVAAVVSLVGLPPQSQWEESDLLARLSEFKALPPAKRPLLASMEAVPQPACGLIKDGLLDFITVPHPQPGTASGDAAEALFASRWLLLKTSNLDSSSKQFPALVKP